MSIVIGLPLGILLVAGEEDGVLPLPKWLMMVLNIVINLLRSVFPHLSFPPKLDHSHGHCCTLPDNNYLLSVVRYKVLQADIA